MTNAAFMESSDTDRFSASTDISLNRTLFRYLSYYSATGYSESRNSAMQSHNQVQQDLSVRSKYT